MRRLANPFSAWVLPLRLLGVIAVLYAFVKMLAAPDLRLIVIAIVGSLLWQAGTLAQKHSPLYRRLESTAVKEIMRTLPVRVPSWTRISRFRNEHPDLGSGVFIVTTQDGYDTGVATPEELSGVPDEIARYTSAAQFAHPLSYMDGPRLGDSVLEAFVRFRRRDVAFLPVFHGGDALAGVVTRHDFDRWLSNRADDGPRLHVMPAERETRAEKKLAA